MKVLSHIGCKNVLSHLFYCNRLHDASGNVCNLCTRLICSSAVHSESFQKLETLHLPGLVKHAHKDFKEIFSIFNCVNEKQELFVKCFIDRSKLNHRSLSEEETNFGDFNPFGANHPTLIFNHMLTIGSRIAMSILFKNSFLALADGGHRC